MDYETETLPLDNGDSFHVYADSCLVCNQQCYLKPSLTSENNSSSDGEKERIIEIRGIIYQAFDIQVGEDFVEENKTELPLCPKCTFKLGQLRHVHYQLATLQREYNKLREEIAFSIVDLVAGSEGSKSYLADIGSKSPNSLLQCMKDSEVETIQHLVFENWHERYSEDELEETSKQGAFNLPTLKQEKGISSQRQSITQNLPGRSDTTVTKTEAPAAKVKPMPLLTTATPSTSGTTKLTSNSCKPESTTKIISITTSKDNTLASVEVSNDDQEVQKIVKGNSNDDDEDDDDNNEVDPLQDDAMVIAMSPTQFCAASECSSPDPSNFLQSGDGDVESENDLDTLDEEDAPFQIRQFEKIKAEPNGSLKFPNDLEVTEWSSDDSQQRGLDYDIFDNDDGSQDFEGIVEGSSSKRMRLSNRDVDMAVDNNSLGSIEFQQNEDGLYVCMFCAKTFIHKYPYRDHLKTHTGEGPRCPVCNKIFPKNHNLMLHMRTHTGEKPYKCMVCSKGFADKSNLKVHMRVHTGERPYKCEYCDQAFVNSSRLVVHRRLHTGEKPFMCDLCNRCFGTSNQLQTHRKIHYEDKGFQCSHCGKSYTSATTLQAHIQLVH